MTFNALYYPSWNPPVEFLRSTLLFFDKIEVIIPTDVDANYDQNNQRVFDLIPDAFGERREGHYGIDLTESGWDRFAKALDVLVEQKPSKKGFRVHIGNGGSVRFEGYAFTHDAKINDRMRGLLIERELLRPDIESYAAGIAGREGFHVVDERASSLLLSLLADTQAARHGLRTVTDEAIGFSLNALNNEFSGHGLAADARLASAIIRTEVPRTIGVLEPKEYVELRKKFETIRVPFQNAVRTLSDRRMLGAISDEDALKAALDEVVDEVHKSVEKARKTATLRTVREWIPFSISTLGAVPAIYSAVGDVPVPAIVGGGLAQVAVTVYEKIKPLKPEDDVQGAERLLAGVRKELLSQSLLRRLVLSRE